MFPEGSDPTANQDWSGLSPSGDSGSCHTCTPAKAPSRGLTPGTSMYWGVGRVVDVELVPDGCVVGGDVDDTVSTEAEVVVGEDVLEPSDDCVPEHPTETAPATTKRQTSVDEGLNTASTISRSQKFYLYFK